MLAPDKTEWREYKFFPPALSFNRLLRACVVIISFNSSMVVMYFSGCFDLLPDITLRKL